MDVAFQPIQGELVSISVKKDEKGKGYLDYEVRITNQGDADAYVGKLAVNALFQIVTGGSTGTTVQCNYECITTRSANPNPGPAPSTSNLIRVPAGGSVTIHYRIYPPECVIGYGVEKVRITYCTPFPGTIYPIAIDQYDLTTGTVQEDPVIGRVQGQTDVVTVPAGLFSPPSSGGSPGPKPCPDQDNPNIARPRASLDFDGVQLVGTDTGLQYQTRPNTTVGVSLTLENPWTQGQLGVTKGIAYYDVTVKDENGKLIKEWKGSTEINVFVVGTSTKTVKLGSFVAKSGKYIVTANVTFKFSDACQKNFKGTVVVHVVQPSGGGGYVCYPNKLGIQVHGMDISGSYLNFMASVCNYAYSPQKVLVELTAYAIYNGKKYKVGEMTCGPYVLGSAIRSPQCVGGIFDPFRIPLKTPEELKNVYDYLPYEVDYKVYCIDENGNRKLAISGSKNSGQFKATFYNCNGPIPVCPGGAGAKQGETQVMGTGVKSARVYVSGCMLNADIELNLPYNKYSNVTVMAFIKGTGVQIIKPFHTKVYYNNYPKSTARITFSKKIEIPAGILSKKSLENAQIQLTVIQESPSASAVAYVNVLKRYDLSRCVAGGGAGPSPQPSPSPSPQPSPTPSPQPTPSPGAPTHTAGALGLLGLIGLLYALRHRRG